MTQGGFWARLLTLSLLLPASSAPEAGASEDALEHRILRSVFIVQAGSLRGLGFLADPTGLVVTEHELGRGTQYVVVQLDEHRRVTGQTLVLDKESGTAILRIAPELVAGLDPLPLAGGPESRLKRGKMVLLARSATSETALTLTRVEWPGVRWRKVAGNLGLAWEDSGGPILDAGGSVVAVNVASRSRRSERFYARDIASVLPALRLARERAASQPPPPAVERRVAGQPRSSIESRADAQGPQRLYRDYRLPAGGWNVEFITPPLLDSLLAETSPSSVAGEIPWRWERQVGAPESAVTVQVIPDLRWTGGSYFRVTGRIVSYPLLAAVLLGLTILGGLSGGQGEFFSGTEPLWKPAHAAYHFKGDFLAAQLLRDGAPVAPLTGLRDCETSEAWVARKPKQKPRWRKIRGCWGTYTFPAAAFESGHALELRLLEEGNEDDPRIVPVPAALVERIRADYQPAPQAAATPIP